MSEQPSKVINTYQPAGKMEEFFQKVGRPKDQPQIHEVLSFDEFCRLIQDDGMELLGPPLIGEWEVTEAGRMMRTDQAQ